MSPLCDIKKCYTGRVDSSYSNINTITSADVAETY